MSPAYNPTPVPDPDPDDCNGHGTHVSGIIGANGGIDGVAPRVKFHAYRVFGCEGSTTADIMLAAMEMVLDNGADVVNMSIGTALAWPQYPTAKAADRLVKTRGRRRRVDRQRRRARALRGLRAWHRQERHRRRVVRQLARELRRFTIISRWNQDRIHRRGRRPAPAAGRLVPHGSNRTATSAADACVALPAGSLTGKVALIRRGTCAFIPRRPTHRRPAPPASSLQQRPRLHLATVAGGVPITIPVVTITAAKGVLIDGRLASGPVTMTWTAPIASEPQPTGGLISSFSSYGLPPDLSFKPDIGAPGGTIRSTLPLEQGGYGNMSGTSMSSPHVAGAVALLLEARPHASPKEVQQRLQNTARPALWWGNPGLGFLDNVHRQGAGMLTSTTP